MLTTDLAARCLDCGEPLTGRFCASCGQRAEPLHRSLREFLSEVTEGITNFDAKLLRTLPALLVRPGFLTAEFNAGRRTRYVHPLRVYLFVTFIFFGLLAVFGKPGTFIDRSHTPSSSAEVNESAASKSFEQGAQKFAAASDKEVLEQFVQRIPQVMFAVLPVAALLLKMAYGRARYYIEHLVFVTHMHSFVFVLLSLFVVLPSMPPLVSQGIPTSLTAVYFFLALKRVYPQGLAVTIAKAAALMLAYAALVGLALSAATLVVIETL